MNDVSLKFKLCHIPEQRESPAFPYTSSSLCNLSTIKTMTSPRNPSNFLDTKP